MSEEKKTSGGAPSDMSKDETRIESGGSKYAGLIPALIVAGLIVFAILVQLVDR